MSEQEREHIEDLVVKYILGEATAQEEQLVDEWREKSSENQRFLEHSQLIYEKAQLPSGHSFDPQKAWTKVAPQLKKGRATQRTLFSPLWKVAAGLALLAVVSYLFYWNLAPGDEYVYLSKNEVVTQTLPDQTEISMNKDSEIKVDYNARKKTGTIQLKGEATISIGKGKEVQWTVEAENLLIRDIGTVFHVKAYPDGQQVEVSVLEGAVQFYSDSDEGILLQAGEKGVYDKASGNYNKTLADTNVVAFKTRSFQFTEENLQTVVDRISEVYGQKIILLGGIETCKITVEFNNEELDTIISILSETMGLDVSENGDEITLSGEGCY
ncbi:FecR domain-containing protein [Algoriphagus aestuariicola]|jgi:ferric-dicitrate binding protein FerR (iron transport regulator)|uniref:FecR domain-containing protein n=1 Tax=Algoriphagus aestuariicola TaxID=1852016 RepID=A0ABS3BWC0_9BACT|nr:FecR domain-containing protein [Algoriphagus aestuariicola]MBN7803362.1 FecR domain-containing protein [Algoriphagus aestuariicola]